MPFSPYPEMRDIYTAVQIRGQSAAALTAGARVNDGRTATAGCALRLARALARALGNFAVYEVIGWTGAPLGRLPAPSPRPWDRDRRLCHFSISTALWRCRSPPHYPPATFAPVRHGGSESSVLLTFFASWSFFARCRPPQSSAIARARARASTMARKINRLNARAV